MSDFPRTRLDALLEFSVSDEQWAVISAPLEPAVVIAGAGSGKTTSMSARVAYLVGAGLVEPQQVLGLTFTRKAAGNLLESFRRSVAPLPVSEEAGEVMVSTYNAFASRLLTEHGLRIGREPGAQLLTEGKREQLAFRLVCRTDLPLDVLDTSPASATTSMLKLDDRLAELDITVDELIAYDEQLITRIEGHGKPQVAGEELLETSRKRIVLARLVEQWRALKAEDGVTDFADQVRLALHLVRRFPEVAAGIREQYAVVLLDEYQDTSLAQRRLLQEIFGAGHAVMAVGDPCQAIYGWRGASVANIEGFVAHFPHGDGRKASRYSLSENRRSGANILEIANELAAPLRAVHAGVEPLSPRAIDRGPGHLQTGLFESYGEELTWVADRIAALGAAEQHWGGISVLAGTGAQLAAVDAELRRRGVPTQLVGAAGLLAQPIVVELRSILSLLHSPTANPEFIRIATGPRWSIGPRDLAALGDRALELAGGRRKENPVSVDDALDDAVRGSDPVEAISLLDAADDPGEEIRCSPQALERLGRLSAEIRMLRRHASEPLTELLGRILHVTGLETEIALAEPAIAEQQSYALTTFMSLAANFGDLDGEVSIGAFLARLDDIERFDVDLRIDVAAREHQVQLMTVHTAKGLEFRHVFVPFVCKDSFPSEKARDTWMRNASVVPWPLREDATAELASYPPIDHTPKAKELDAYKDVLREIERLDGRRLAYVAFTRAEVALTVTGYWWGPTQKKVRGPGEFLDAMHEACLGGAGEVICWSPKPEDDAENPALGVVPVAWPVDGSGRRERLLNAAALVRDAREPEMLSAQEQETVDRWDQHLAALLAEADRNAAEEIVVPAPDALSASALMRALSDPEGLALDILRPMPNAPAPAARRGTEFHAWVEQRFGQQSLLDPDDLPGAADAGIVDDEALARLKEAFEGSEFAQREPVAVEAPFSLVIGGRVIKGRIDAVFANGDRFDVIDWKTGSADALDPLQLAIYRLAWAQVRAVPIEQVDAAFYVVGTGETIRPESFPDLSIRLR